MYTPYNTPALRDTARVALAVAADAVVEADAEGRVAGDLDDDARALRRRRVVGSWDSASWEGDAAPLPFGTAAFSVSAYVCVRECVFEGLL